ncbi:E3 ubiquitin-protein ligase TRIM7 isoform X3 [Opisthocomus hoazin]|uniref:E3 ubiquitin-protein ligase TRIM7 isoform X3 n=1 Tax=Opisthocomus hoazin TaxID=30419 RepID=UPI003F52B944
MAQSLGQRLEAEATCPLCLELFSAPVVTECGHSFCGRCLRAVLGTPPRPAACPQCRAVVAPGSPRPNVSLRAVAELAAALAEEARRPLCPEHGEALGLFCQSCRCPLCPLCREGPPHRRHRVQPAAEAARELRETLQSNLGFLRKEREEFKPRGEEKSVSLLDVGKTLSSCEAAKAPIPEPVSPELQRTIESLSETNQLVMGAMAKFKANLLSETDRERVKVTLDPETASPYLFLSKDCRTVWLGEWQQNLPDTPKRFTGSPSVLGSPGFTAGRHYWELEVGDGDSWAAGVAVESVQRKDSLSLAMGKIWAMRLDWDRRYTALHMVPAPLALKEEPRRIRVHLDYEAGQVTFYNAENMTQILQFKASFTETVFPYFWLWSQETSIQLCA